MTCNVNVFNEDDKLAAENVRKQVENLQKKIAEQQHELMQEKKQAAIAMEQQVILQ